MPVRGCGVVTYVQSVAVPLPTMTPVQAVVPVTGAHRLVVVIILTGKEKTVILHAVILKLMWTAVVNIV